MNNEEKILAILEMLLEKVENLETLVPKVEKLEALVPTVERLVQAQAELKQDVAELTNLVHGVMHHQNEDYALLKAVSEKVDRLANVTQDHEEKFRKIRAL